MFHANILLALWLLSALPFCVLGRHLPVEPRSRSRESGKAFLTDLYHKHFDEHGEIKRINSGVSKIIHAVQGKGMSSNRSAEIICWGFPFGFPHTNLDFLHTNLDFLHTD